MVCVNICIFGLICSEFLSLLSVFQLCILLCYYVTRVKCTSLQFQKCWN